MYRPDEFMIVSREIAMGISPDLVGDVDRIMLGNSIGEAPTAFIIGFQLTLDTPKAVKLKKHHIDINRFGPAMSPQEWLVAVHEENLEDWKRSYTIAVFPNTEYYDKLQEWVLKNARRYRVLVQVKGLPLLATMTGYVMAISEERACVHFYSLCSGMPVDFGLADVQVDTEISWGQY